MKQKHQSSTKSKKNEINHMDAVVAVAEAEAVSVSAPKRTKDPGVRLVHGRIYDSQNGKTCHQVCLDFDFVVMDFCVELVLIVVYLYVQ